MGVHVFPIPNPPPGHPSAPAPSILPLHQTWTGDSCLIWYYTCFSAILPNHPTLTLSHRVQKTVRQETLLSCLTLGPPIMLIQTLCILSVFTHHSPTEQRLDNKHFILDTFTWMVKGMSNRTGSKHLPLSYLKLLATFLSDAQAKILEFSLAPLPLIPYVQSLCKPSTLHLQTPCWGISLWSSG